MIMYAHAHKVLRHQQHVQHGGLTLLESRLEHAEPLSGEGFPEKGLLVLATTAEGAHPLKGRRQQ